MALIRPSIYILIAAAMLGCAGPRTGVKIDETPVGATPTKTVRATPAVRNPSHSDRLHAHFLEWHGVPHRYGGQSKQGIDCSGFVQLTYQQLFSMALPRRTAEQVKSGVRADARRLAVGDLVFFKTGWRQRHVGIYIGDDHFIHASARRGIAKSSLASPYWSKHFWKARRIGVL